MCHKTIPTTQNTVCGKGIKYSPVLQSHLRGYQSDNCTRLWAAVARIYIFFIQKFHTLLIYSKKNEKLKIHELIFWGSPAAESFFYATRQKLSKIYLLVFNRLVKVLLWGFAGKLVFYFVIWSFRIIYL